MPGGDTPSTVTGCNSTASQDTCRPGELFRLKATIAKELGKEGGHHGNAL